MEKGHGKAEDTPFLCPKATTFSTGKQKTSERWDNLLLYK
jgi:hypothetical protein